MKEAILKTLQALKEGAEKRNFSQTYDFIVNLKEIDLKKAENKIDEAFHLPHGRGRDAHVVLFSDAVKSVEGAEVISSSDLEKLAMNKRTAKKLANEADFLFGDPKVMALVGKHLGTILGPRGKVPKLLVGDVNSLVSSSKGSTRIRLKDAPVIQCTVGTDKMSDEHVAENIEALVKHLERRLPRGKANISKMQVKLTMGKPAKLELA
ncbi:MAG: 50S ribosomal protein L1 [Candidatus Aenigmarchaeota archaeon]|nr:50S ribosomal protein L1 [Candidatus Aenigmarchaeota archaeon]